MKKNLYLSVSSVILICFFCFIYSCKKAATVPPPVACVSPMTDTVRIGTPVTFTGCTQGATAYLWNFGDGSTATTDTATHTYTTPGSYTVSFTPSNSGGAGTAKTFTLLVTAGSWSLEGTTYGASSCTISSGELFATSTAANGNITTLELLFYNQAPPTTSGTFVVNQFALTPNEINIQEYTTTSTGSPISAYGSTSNGTQQVYISVIGGKIIASTAGVEMANGSSPYDSASMTFNLIQQ